MTELTSHEPDALERLLIGQLDRQAAALDLSPLHERIRATVAAEAPMPAADPRRPLRWARWGAGVAAVACLIVAGIIYWPDAEKPLRASPQALLQETQKTLHQPVYRCYLVEVQREANLTDDSNPFVSQAKQTRLWTRGDRFWMETTFPDFPWRRNSWGRNEQGTIWMTFGPREGVLLKESETPRWLSVYCDLCSMKPDWLIAEMLRDFDLHREETPGDSSTQIIKAELKPGRWHPGIKSALLELDTETKVLRRVVLHRAGPVPLTTTYTLVETKNQDEVEYPLDGREGKREFYTADYKPEKRQQLVMPLFAQRAAEWMRPPLPPFKK